MMSGYYNNGKALSPITTSFNVACFEGILVGTMVYNKEEEQKCYD